MPRTTSINTLRAKIKELEAKAAALEQAEKRGIVQLKAVIKKYRLTPADIKLASGNVGGLRRKRGALKGTKLKAKYRNPKNAKETWAGRGIRPKWLTAMLKQGKKIEDFAV